MISTLATTGTPATSTEPSLPPGGLATIGADASAAIPEASPVDTSLADFVPPVATSGAVIQAATPLTASPFADSASLSPMGSYAVASSEPGPSTPMSPLAAPFQADGFSASGKTTELPVYISFTEKSYTLFAWDGILHRSIGESFCGGC